MRLSKSTHLEEILILPFTGKIFFIFFIIFILVYCPAINVIWRCEEVFHILCIQIQILNVHNDEIKAIHSLIIKPPCF